MADTDTFARELREQRQMLMWIIEELIATHVDLTLIADDLRMILETTNKFEARQCAETIEEQRMKLLEAAFGRAARRAHKLGLDDLKQYFQE